MEKDLYYDAFCQSEIAATNAMRDAALGRWGHGPQAECEKKPKTTNKKGDE